MPMQEREPELLLEETVDPGVGVERPTLGQWASLFAHALRRRKLLAFLVFVMGVSASLAYYRSKTPLYRVETKVLAQRSQAFPSIMRATVLDESPTRSAWELVHRRENLIALVKEANLAPGRAARAKPDLPDTRRLPTSGPAAAQAEDPEGALVLELDRKLLVKTGDGTITISIDWRDPEQAYQIVTNALQNFLEARHLQEITPIDQVISLLEGRVSTYREQLDATIEQVQREVLRAGPGLARTTTGNPRVPQPSEELIGAKSMLDAKERQIRDLEEMRLRRLADLQAQLDQTRTVYSEAHPSVIALRRDIETLSRESPQILALREEAAALRRQYAARLAQEGAGAREAAAAVTATATSAMPRPMRLGRSEFPEEDERVRSARDQYQGMVAKLNQAQLDLDTARAAFKLRYNVIWPAEVPKDPVSPNPVKVFGLGILGALFLAVFAAAYPDLRRGRIVERWQIERTLRLPILAELERP